MVPFRTPALPPVRVGSEWFFHIDHHSQGFLWPLLSGRERERERKSPLRRLLPRTWTRLERFPAWSQMAAYVNTIPFFPRPALVFLSYQPEEPVSPGYFPSRPLLHHPPCASIRPSDPALARRVSFLPAPFPAASSPSSPWGTFKDAVSFKVAEKLTFRQPSSQQQQQQPELHHSSLNAFVIRHISKLCATPCRTWPPCGLMRNVFQMCVCVCVYGNFSKREMKCTAIPGFSLG